MNQLTRGPKLDFPLTDIVNFPQHAISNSNYIFRVLIIRAGMKKRRLPQKAGYYFHTQYFFFVELMRFIDAAANLIRENKNQSGRSYYWLLNENWR
ncbi:hypothetical protein [Leclercia tamurae]|uniref:hypothetical protein n=1 Tax=Leclercia tamurae TaxID=2926467 RepID=UPI0036F46234